MYYYDDFNYEATGNPDATIEKMSYNDEPYQVALDDDDDDDDYDDDDDNGGGYDDGNDCTRVLLESLRPSSKKR